MTDDGGSDQKPRNDDDMDALLTAIRTVAREDDAAVAAFSGEAPTLSLEARAAITDRILALQAESGRGSTAAEARAKNGGRVEAGRRAPHRTRAAWWAGSGVALAAAAWALVVWTRPPSVGAEGALPAYSITASGGIAATRAAGPADGASGRIAPVQRVGAQSELQIALRPDSAVAGAVAVRAFFSQGGNSTEVRPDVETAATGAVALRIRGSALPPHQDGPGELRVVIGRPSIVAGISVGGISVGGISQAAEATDGEGQRWLVVPLDLAK